MGFRGYYFTVSDILSLPKGIKTCEFQTLVPQPSRHQGDFGDPLLQKNRENRDHQDRQGTEHRYSDVRDGGTSVPTEERHTQMCKRRIFLWSV